ncbi:MAG: hypothetical protein M1283_01445 [Gammaproteobacteria bacterium]|nr:hypothetical protein [Gammaproteobacteria bacterium]
MTGPTLPTIKRLFGVSGNRCAFPECSNSLVDPSGKVTGRISHIKGRRPRGPRHDPLQDDDERHGFDNLILLCPIHHDVVDDDEVSYSVARLSEIKRSHETSVHTEPEPSDEIASQFLATFHVSGPGSTVVSSHNQTGGITAGTLNITVAPEPKPQPPELPSCFLPAADAFSALITRNFLFEFDGPKSDYVELLSGDLRRLFFSLFNDHLRPGTVNRLLVSGHEGSGKTFNALLLSLQLSREGYAVHYCHDIRSTSLTPESLRPLAIRDDDSTILIVDNSQHDLIKAEQLISAISQAGTYAGRPLFLFLTRPLDDDTLLDTFGANTPVLTMREHFVDFERLVRLRFRQLGEPDAASGFLESVGAAKLTGLPIKYRNMAFWNEVLRSLAAGSIKPVTEEDILKRAHAFLRRKESFLLDFRETLSLLLPLFGLGVAIHADYASELIGRGASEVLRTLAAQGVLAVVEQDWESEKHAHTSALVVAPRLHPTKAKLLARLYTRYYGYTADPAEALADYAERFPQCLYHILGHYSDPEEMRLVYSNARVRAITRWYLLKRPLGKKLDGVIRRLAVLDDSAINAFFDGDVLQAFARQVNGSGAYIVSKLYVLRALYRVSPAKAYELFCLLTPDAVSKTFLADGTEGGVTSLAKWMEIFKNIYYYAPTPEAKEAVRCFVRKVIDDCRAEFIRRLAMRHSSFTQLHWLLKRLHGLKLGVYFLERIEPEKLVELIRGKDTNVVELCKYVLLDARYTFRTESDGQRRRYSDILRDTLTYDDLKRVFDNRRSGLYALAINANHDFVAKALVRYAGDPNFRGKAVRESTYLRNESVQLISKNCYLTEDDKARVAAAITEAEEQP